MKLAILVGMLPSPMTDVDDAEAAVAVYQNVLADLPPWAVESACDLALKGKVGAAGGRWRPTPGELYEASERAVTDAAKERAAIDRVLHARLEAPRLSAEDRAAAIARVKSLAKSVADAHAVPKNEKAILDAGGKLDNLGMRKVAPDSRDQKKDELEIRREAQARLDELERESWTPKPSPALVERMAR